MMMSLAGRFFAGEWRRVREGPAMDCGALGAGSGFTGQPSGCSARLGCGKKKEWTWAGWERWERGKWAKEPGWRNLVSLRIWPIRDGLSKAFWHLVRLVSVLQLFDGGRGEDLVERGGDKARTICTYVHIHN